MTSTASPPVFPDANSKDKGEIRIRNALWAARKKARVVGLCTQCSGIMGWFLLDPEVFVESVIPKLPTDFDPPDYGFKVVGELKFKKRNSSCKLCNFFYDFRPREKAYRSSRYMLGIATVEREFGFLGRHGKSPIFSIKPYIEPYTVFGLLNKETDQDRVAIRRLSPMADLSRVREWIQFCDENHTNSDLVCRPKVKNGISLEGFKVIDCKDRRNVLVQGTALEYVTLSYVWGSEVPEFPDKSGRLPSALPELIQGVIEVVLDLGYRYLWIDRYCVPQHDSSDIKTLLLQNMHEIYSRSTLTIIAAASICPSEGLTGITRPRKIKQQLFQLNSIQLIPWVNDVKDEIKCSIWNSRGWTYQEALLSRRKLVFTEKQCYFQCGTGHHSYKEMSRIESIDYDLKSEKSGGNDYGTPLVFPSRLNQSFEHLVAGFNRRVNDYIQRRLSRDCDVLPAFLGILSMFMSENADFHGHLHGVPIFDPKVTGPADCCTDAVGIMIAGFTWWFESDYEGIIPSRRKVFPSWSWCDWIHDSPSPYQIHWETDSLGTGDLHPRVDMQRVTTLHLEFDNGAILPWPRELNTYDLAKQAMTMGSVRFIHISGWATNLSIPGFIGPYVDDDDWPVLPLACGPYAIYAETIFWLQRLAKERAMNLTKKGEYHFKAWVFAPAVVGLDIDDWLEAYMMILGETSDSNTFERVEVCRVALGYRGEDDWKWEGTSVEEMAEMFGWELKSFKLA